MALNLPDESLVNQGLEKGVSLTADSYGSQTTRYLWGSGPALASLA